MIKLADSRAPVRHFLVPNIGSSAGLKKKDRAIPAAVLCLWHAR
jgi:hypothetical protein